MLLESLEGFVLLILVVVTRSLSRILLGQFGSSPGEVMACRP